MRYDKARAVLHESYHCLLNVHFRSCVDRGCCFVEDEYLRVCKDCSRNGKKLALSLAPLPDDKDEHFVDVTAQYMGRSGVKLQNFLAQKQELGPFAKQAEDEEKFAKLDYNPLKDRPPMTVRSLQQEKQEAAKAQAAKKQEPVERVTINTRDAVVPASKQNTGDAKRLTMLVDGSEAAELPLTPGQNFKLKAGDYTVEISINPDESK